MKIKNIQIPERVKINHYVENHEWFMVVFRLIAAGELENIEEKLDKAVNKVLSTIEDLPMQFTLEEVRCYQQAKMLIRTKKFYKVIKNKNMENLRNYIRQLIPNNYLIEVTLNLENKSLEVTFIKSIYDIGTMFSLFFLEDSIKIEYPENLDKDDIVFKYVNLISYNKEVRDTINNLLDHIM